LEDNNHLSSKEPVISFIRLLVGWLFKMVDYALNCIAWVVPCCKLYRFPKWM